MRVERGAWSGRAPDEALATIHVRGQTLTLSEVAVLIVSTVPESGAATLDEITGRVVERFGEPQPPLDAAEMTRQHVLELIGHGVLADVDAESVSYTPDSVSALRDALRHVVSADNANWELPPTVSGHELVSAAERHRVVPTLAASLDRLVLPPESTARLAAIHRRESATVHRLADELAEIVGTLADAGVRVLAVKGLALAQQAHGDVAARGTGDHDLLVSPQDLASAHRVLTRSGWRPSGHFPVPGDSWAWRRMIRDDDELTLVAPGSSIDLHWQLGPVRTAFPTFDELWRRRATVPIGGCDVPTLCPYDALAHSASHSAKDHWRWLRGLLDVHRLMSLESTWAGVDRPLSHTELVTIGLAGRMLGVPEAAPPVARDAVAMTSKAWPRAVASQAGPSHVNVATRIPGAGLAKTLPAMRRAGAGPKDILRQLSRSALPPGLTGDEPSPHAVVAVPRVLRRRTAEVTRLWWRALRNR